MPVIRRSKERGHANHGWLDSHHTFSFASYYDPEHMGFGPLRVINEDRVKGGAGFGRHPHRDMEILSYVVDGGLKHQDSMGNGSVIRPGEIQLMSAGTGVTHSEFNASDALPVHFLQIWIEPARRGTDPQYGQRSFTPDERRDRWLLLVSPEGEEGALRIGQDARVYTSLVSPGVSLGYALSSGRRAWVQVVKGSLRVGDDELVAGDGVAFANHEGDIVISASTEAELLLFDLP